MVMLKLILGLKMRLMKRFLLILASQKRWKLVLRMLKRLIDRGSSSRGITIFATNY